MLGARTPWLAAKLLWTLYKRSRGPTGRAERVWTLAGESGRGAGVRNHVAVTMNSEWHGDSRFLLCGGAAQAALRRIRFCEGDCFQTPRTRPRSTALFLLLTTLSAAEPTVYVLFKDSWDTPLIYVGSSRLCADSKVEVNRRLSRRQDTLNSINQ